MGFIAAEALGAPRLGGGEREGEALGPAEGASEVAVSEGVTQVRSGGRGEAGVARELAVTCSARHGVRRARARALGSGRERAVQPRGSGAWTRRKGGD